MNRYTPSRQYLYAGTIALVLAIFSAWCALEWPFAGVAAFLFVVSSALVLWLAFRPAIEIQERNLVVGNRVIPWLQIRRVDRTGWISPLVVTLTLADQRRLTLVYPGDLDSANLLLRQIRRGSREALIDGQLYRQFWGEATPQPERRPLASPKYQILRAEDEEDVERMFQRLKTVGHLDPKSSDEKK